MKKFFLPALSLAVVAVTFSPNMVWAEDDPLAQEETEAAAVKDRPEWSASLKTKFNLTDEQIKTMQSQGMNFPQMAITAGLAQKSGKTIDEVTKMRTEGKMGWGAIAKELGVAPKEIGQSVREMRHSIRDARHAERAERREEKLGERAQRHAERMERKADRMERMEREAARKAERAEKKGN